MLQLYENCQQILFDIVAYMQKVYSFEGWQGFRQNRPKICVPPPPKKNEQAYMPMFVST